MAGLSYIIPDNGAEIDFDITVSETHVNATEVTDHPVEKGVNVSDHAKPLPITLSLVVEVSNTPRKPDDKYGGSFQTSQLSLPSSPGSSSPFVLAEDAIAGALSGPANTSIQTLSFPAPFDKINDTHVALAALERSGGTSDVVTSTANYTSMILTKVSYEKTEAGSGSFSLDFKQILVVSSSTVSAPAPAEPRGKPAAAKGSQATSGVDGSSASLAHKIKDGAANALKSLVGG